ncbi:MAG: hypothetical protein AAFZ15_24890 [Bacteroidota bacterium]
MVSLSPLGENLADAHRRHKEVKEEYPQYADKARMVLIAYMKKYDPESLRVYLGKEDEPLTGKKDRFSLYHLQKNICFALEELDGCKGEEHRNEYMFKVDHHIRDWLWIPYRTVEDNTLQEIKDLLSPD